MASILKVDALQGVTAAGSILVTGEGNSTTTNLQQGLAKAWARIDASGTMTAQNSLNLSSLTDGGVGQVEMNFSTSFNDAEYAGAGMAGNDGTTTGNRSQVVDNTPATGNFHFRNISGTSGNQDDANIMMSIHGDLA